MIAVLKKSIRTWQTRRRFPLSVIHSDAIADNSSILAPYSVLFSDTVVLNSTIGKFTYIQTHSMIDHAQIGSFCSIARNVHIGLASHPTNMLSTSPVLSDYGIGVLPKYFIQNSLPIELILPKTIIEADVWIGTGAMIKAGVTIGVGAVIGAGAMVTHDVEPYSVVGGIPAREIKKRFDEKTIERLVSSRWWELDETTLERLSPLFGDPSAFLDAIEENSR